LKILLLHILIIIHIIKMGRVSKIFNTLHKIPRGNYYNMHIKFGDGTHHEFIIPINANKFMILLSDDSTYESATNEYISDLSKWDLILIDEDEHYTQRAHEHIYGEYIDEDEYYTQRAHEHIYGGYIEENV
jgi:hypothetical protein